MEWQREGVPFLPKTFTQQVNGAEVGRIIDGQSREQRLLAAPGRFGFHLLPFPLTTFLN